MVMLMINILMMLMMETKVVFIKAAMARDEARARRRAEEAKILVRLQCLQSSLAQDGGANHWQLCITDRQKKHQNSDKKVPGVA